jgi:hypothetical protein
MAAQRQTKAQLLATIEADRAALEELLAEAGPGRLEEPGVMGDWTLKDAVAHLTGWRLRTIARLEAAARHAEPVAPWPAELEAADAAGDPHAYEPINQWLYRQHHDRPAADILRESDESFRNLAAAAGALSEQALMTPGQFEYDWLEGQALGPALIGGASDHLHEEHLPGIRAWLARRPAS